MKKVAISIIAVLGSVGCREAPAHHVVTTVPNRLPSGWTLATSEDGSNSIGIAPGWRAGVDRLSDGAGIPDLGSSSPGSEMGGELGAQLANMDREAEAKALEGLRKKGILLHVLNGSKPVFDEARTRYYVIKKELSRNADWATATDWERKRYPFPPKPQEVELPIGKAYRFSSDDTLRNGSVRHEISYVAIEGKRMYALRFVTQEDASTIVSIADQAAKSWRIKPI